MTVRILVSFILIQVEHLLRRLYVGCMSMCALNFLMHRVVFVTGYRLVGIGCLLMLLTGLLQLLLRVLESMKRLLLLLWMIVVAGLLLLLIVIVMLMLLFVVSRGRVDCGLNRVVLSLRINHFTMSRPNMH